MFIYGSQLVNNIAYITFCIKDLKNDFLVFQNVSHDSAVLQDWNVDSTT